MAYCTASDIQSLIKWIVFSASSKVTLSDLENFYIPEADKYIDSVLGSVYAVPVANADDIKILTFISARLVAVQVAHVLVSQAGGEPPKIIQVWQSDAERRLKDLRELKILLPNTNQCKVPESASGLWSHTASDTSSEETWKLNEDQW